MTTRPGRILTMLLSHLPLLLLCRETPPSPSGERVGQRRGSVSLQIWRSAFWLLLCWNNFVCLWHRFCFKYTEFACDLENVKTLKDTQLFCAQEGVRNLHRPNDFVGSIQHLLYKVKLQAKWKMAFFLLTFSSGRFPWGPQVNVEQCDGASIR